MTTEQIVLRIIARISVFAILGADICAVAAVLVSVLVSITLNGIETRLDLSNIFQNIFFGVPVALMVGARVGLLAFGIAAAQLKPQNHLTTAFKRISVVATISSLIGVGIGAICGSMLGLFLSPVLHNLDLSQFLSPRVIHTFYFWAGGFFFGALFGFAVGFIGGAIYGAKETPTAS
jgi:hypothetical protein